MATREENADAFIFVNLRGGVSLDVTAMNWLQSQPRELIISRRTCRLTLATHVHCSVSVCVALNTDI